MVLKLQNSIIKLVSSCIYDLIINVASSSRVQEFIRILLSLRTVFCRCTEGQCLSWKKVLSVFCGLIEIRSFPDVLYNNQKMSKTIDSVCLARLLVKAAWEGCHIIEELGGKANAKMKDIDDPVTEVDHTVQRAISNRILQTLPTVRIVGEEQVDEHMVLDHQHHSFPIVNNLDFTAEVKTDKLELEHLCIFIDPLDCTRGYIFNTKWECTVLIGATYHKQPVLGVIGQPYSLGHQNNSHLFKPNVILGGTLLNSKAAIEIVTGAQGKIELNRLECSKNFGNKVAVSSRRSGKKQTKMIKRLNLEEMYCGGSGNKIAKVVRGQTDAAMFIQSPTSTWDSCAGEAIILGMGGFFVKPDLSKIEYSWEGSQLNQEGFICGLSENLYAKVLLALQ